MSHRPIKEVISRISEHKNFKSSGARGSDNSGVGSFSLDLPNMGEVRYSLIGDGSVEKEVQVGDLTRNEILSSEELDAELKNLEHLKNSTNPAETKKYSEELLKKKQKSSIQKNSEPSQKEGIAENIGRMIKWVTSFINKGLEAVGLIKQDIEEGTEKVTNRLPESFGVAGHGFTKEDREKILKTIIENYKAVKGDQVTNKDENLPHQQTHQKNQKSDELSKPKESPLQISDKPYYTEEQNKGFESSGAVKDKLFARPVSEVIEESEKARKAAEKKGGEDEENRIPLKTEISDIVSDLKSSEASHTSGERSWQNTLDHSAQKGNNSGRS